MAKLNPCITAVVVYFDYPAGADPYAGGFEPQGNNEEHNIRTQRFFDEMTADERWTHYKAECGGVYGEDGMEVTIPLNRLPKGWSLNRTINYLKEMYDRPVPKNARKIETCHHSGDKPYTYHYAELTPDELEEERKWYEG